MNVAVAVTIAAVVVLAAVLLFAMSRRQDRTSALGVLSRETVKRDRSRDAVAPIAEAEAAPPTGREVERAAARAGTGEGTGLVKAPSQVPATVTLPPLDEEALGVTRRQFLNRSILGLFGVSLGAFGAACIGFLWPTLSGGFGSTINAGKLDDILTQIRDKGEPFYVPEGRLYLNPYPPTAIPKAVQAYSGGVLLGMEAGVVALYQKCVHLGCRVPWCKSSQWFECPCHGSQYNRVGEKKGGPAPRGLDRFAVSVNNGLVSIDTKTIVQGPPIGTNTTGQEAEGPHCR